MRPDLLFVALSSRFVADSLARARSPFAALITISHRPSLFQHHLYLLRLTGDHGQWEFTKIGEADQCVLLLVLLFIVVVPQL